MISPDSMWCDVLALTAAGAAFAALAGIAAVGALVVRELKRFNQLVLDCVLRSPSHAINRMADELQDTRPKIVQSLALLVRGMERVASKIEDRNRQERTPRPAQ